MHSFIHSFIHSFMTRPLTAVIGILIICSEIGLAVRCLPVFGCRMLLLHSSLLFSSPRGIALSCSRASCIDVVAVESCVDMGSRHALLPSLGRDGH